MFLILGSSPIWAQSVYTERDSIEDAQVMEQFFYKTKFQVSLSHEKTLLAKGVDIKMNILKVGVQYRKNYKMGLYYGFSKSYNTYEPELPSVAHYETRILAFGGYFEYVFIEDYRWYLGAPVSIGRGKAVGIAYDVNNDELPYNNWESDNFGIFSMGANGGFNINHWITLSGGLGYRFTNSANPNSKKNLRTLFYTYGLKVKFGHLLTTVFHHKDVNSLLQ
jgi:hypothetical protein